MDWGPVVILLGAQLPSPSAGGGEGEGNGVELPRAMLSCCGISRLHRDEHSRPSPKAHCSLVSVGIPSGFLKQVDGRGLGGGEVGGGWGMWAQAGREPAAGCLICFDFLVFGEGLATRPDCLCLRSQSRQKMLGREPWKPDENARVARQLAI